MHVNGEVEEVDASEGRLRFRPLDKRGYVGRPPSMIGAGSWEDPLLPVQRPEDVALLFEVEPDEAGDSEEESDLPLNLILYGPPGTGKTYDLRERLMPRFRKDARGAHGAVDVELLERISWFELIAASLHEVGRPATVKDLAQHRWVAAKFAIQPFKSPIKNRLWGVLQTHAVLDSETVQYPGRSGELIFDKNGESQWFMPGGAPEHVQELADALAEPMGSRERFRFTTFHQSYGYEDFIEGIKPRTTDDEGSGELAYALEDGLFKKAVHAAIGLTGYEHSVDEFCSELSREERADLLKDAPPYAVFVDEINRGNVARIFGELITLIEPTRRLGQPEELIVTLPGSRTHFGVPSNLHLIGTMNTADRSVEALDTALRRRFAFENRPPRPDLLDAVVDGNIETKQMLTKINQRLLKLLDRDHLIGHAYFMPLEQDRSFERLLTIFRDSIRPLLEEYFYGDWGRIGLVLGKAFVRRHDHGDVSFASFPHDDADALGERSTYEWTDLEALSNEDFRRIYTDGTADDQGS